MKVLLSLLPLETHWQPDLWPRPLGLWRLAGEPIIRHVVDNLSGLLNMWLTELCFVVKREDSLIAAWMREAFAGRPLQLLSLPQNDTILQIARQTHEWWAQDEEVWLVEGRAILEAKYLAVAEDIKMLAAALEPDEEPVGISSWKGSELWKLISSYPSANNLSELWERFAYGSVDVGVVEPHTFLPVVEYTAAGWQSRPELLLHANARLLGLGSGSEDAIERSYVEDFTVLPPVYLDESAVIYGAIIGPYTSVEAGATIRNSVVGNSIIGAGAQVSHIILDGSVVGEGAMVSGRAETILIGDNREYIKQSAVDNRQ